MVYVSEYKQIRYKEKNMCFLNNVEDELVGN